MEEDFLYTGKFTSPELESIMKSLFDIDFKKNKDINKQSEQKKDDNVFQEMAIKEAYNEGFEDGTQFTWRDVRYNSISKEQCDYNHDKFVNVVWTEDNKVFLAYYSKELGIWYDALSSMVEPLKVKKYITIKLPESNE